MFTTNHFIWMGICAAMIGLLLTISLKAKFTRKQASLVMALIAAVSEVCKIITHMKPATGGGSVLEPDSLPLHLCSILIFLIFFCAFSSRENQVEKVTSLCVPVSLWGGALAILMATSGVSFVKPFAYQCFLYHAGLLWWGLHLIFTKQVDLGLYAYLRNLKVLGGMLLMMIWVNSALSVYDTNFWFVVRPPAEGLPLLNLDNGWLCYFLTLVGIGLLALTITHLPHILKERKNAKTADNLQ